jgi:hypothetical protein
MSKSRLAGLGACDCYHAHVKAAVATAGAQGSQLAGNQGKALSLAETQLVLASMLQLRIWVVQRTLQLCSAVASVTPSLLHITTNRVWGHV